MCNALRQCIWVSLAQDGGAGEATAGHLWHGLGPLVPDLPYPLCCVYVFVRESLHVCVWQWICVHVCWYANEKETSVCVPIVSPHYPTLRGSLPKDSRRKGRERERKHNGLGEIGFLLTPVVIESVCLDVLLLSFCRSPFVCVPMFLYVWLWVSYVIVCACVSVQIIVWDMKPSLSHTVTNNLLKHCINIAWFLAPLQLITNSALPWPLAGKYISQKKFTYPPLFIFILSL